MNQSLNLEKINAALHDQDAEIIVSFAADRFGSGLVMSSSFGAESAMLIHLVHQIDPDIPVIFVDTGFHFAQTHQFIQELKDRLSLNLHVYRPRLSAEEFFASMSESDPEWRNDVNRCCAVNKNEPFDRAMRELRPTAWLRGIRRDQADTRLNRQTVEWSNRFNCYAISPLLDYSSEEIHAYLKLYDLPTHPLVAQGYTSIGCSPRSCTRPIQINESGAPAVGADKPRPSVDCIWDNRRMLNNVNVWATFSGQTFLSAAGRCNHRPESAAEYCGRWQTGMSAPPLFQTDALPARFIGISLPMKALKPYLPPILMIVAATAIYLGRSLYQAKEVVPWRLDPTAAMAEARSKNKPAFLYFTATWCGPCQSLKHTTWADPAVAKALADYVPIKIDVDQFSDLDRQYPSDGIPHFVVIDGNGKVVRDITGAMDSKEFLDWLGGKTIG